VRSGLAGGAQSLENKRFSADQSFTQKSAIYVKAGRRCTPSRRLKMHPPCFLI
jgi:hypothetical protein